MIRLATKLTTLAAILLASGPAWAGEGAAAGNNAVSSAGSTGSLAFTLLSFAVLAIGGICFLMSRKAYPSRKHRRVGPFARLREALSRVSSFLP